MPKFDEILNNYRINILEEQLPNPAAAAPNEPAAAAPAPTPVPSAGAEEMPPDPKEVVDKLEKSSKKPWVDLAGVLARAMEYKWSDEEINRINNSLPGGLTMRDFINAREGKIKDPNDANVVTAAVNFFDQVDNLMGEDDFEEIVPADER